MPSEPAESTCILNNEPVVLSWDDCNVNHGEATYLGNRTNLTALLIHSVKDETATLRIRVPFQSTKKDEPFLYIFIDPSCILSIHRHSSELSLPETVCKSPLGKLSHHEIIGFNLCLEAPSIVVGPAGIASLHPKGKVPGNVLASLRSLSQAVNLDIFVRQNEVSRRKLQQLCEAVNCGKVTACATTYTYRSLYGGTGGACVTQLLEPFQFRPLQLQSKSPLPGPSALDEEAQADAGAEPPPAYDDVDESPPVAPPVLKSMKRRISSPKTLPTSKRLDLKSASTSYADISTLRFELESLKQQLQWHTALKAGTPTEDGFLLDRLDAFESRLCALEARPQFSPSSLASSLIPTLLQEILPQVQAHVELQIENEIFTQVQTEVETAVEEKMAEYRGDIEERLEEARDEIELGVEEKVERVVNEELGGVVQGMLEEVVGQCLENASLSVSLAKA